MILIIIVLAFFGWEFGSCNNGEYPDQIDYGVLNAESQIIRSKRMFRAVTGLQPRVFSAAGSPMRNIARGAIGILEESASGLAQKLTLETAAVASNPASGPASKVVTKNVLKPGPPIFLRDSQAKIRRMLDTDNKLSE